MFEPDSLPWTERTLAAAADLDRRSALEIVRLMAVEDARVPAAVAREEERIARAVDVVAEHLAGGGRLIYLGAGTSGRLGALDAAECPPTFGTPPEQVVGAIAGGPEALVWAVEGAEDDAAAGARTVDELAACERDVVVGISASGGAPWVLAGLVRARELGAFGIALCCTPGSPLAAEADLAIEPLVGPEVVAGSTRLKAGTATKLVLNAISTGAMVRLGRVVGNRMVDLSVSNSKLRARALRTLAELAGLDAEAAAELLEATGGDLRAALEAARGAPPQGQLPRGQ